MSYRKYHAFNLLLFGSLACTCRADSGDDFSNNLFSDLAPLLALFGERVTMQFLSQSMGWLDCIILAMGPLGIITTIVSAIRVDCPPWLKAIIGRSRENLSVAEMELMSSTSEETCELWNGRDVVRCQGLAPVTEFICLVPNEGADNSMQIRFMDMEEALQEGLLHKEDSQPVKFWDRTAWKRKTQRQATVQNMGGSDARPETPTSGILSSILSRPPSADEEAQDSIPMSNRPSEHPAQSTPVQCPTSSGQTPELVILRNTSTKAPNITLNRYHKPTQGQLLAVAVFGTILQLGVLVYFAFITYYPTLKFKKDDKEIVGYAFPLASGGTVILVFGMLLCAHVVDRSTEEETYEPSKDRKMGMIWLQQKQTISDQVFHSFALLPQGYPQVITTSQRRSKITKVSNGKEESSVSSGMEARNASTSLRQRIRPSKRPSQEPTSNSEDQPSRSINLCVIATLICLVGFLIQFIGLRGMHWSASVGQLIAVIVMTALRAYVRRGFTAPMSDHKLRNRFELDGLALALGSSDSNTGPGLMFAERGVNFQSSKNMTWIVRMDDGSSKSKTPNSETPHPGRTTSGKGLVMRRRGNSAKETLEIRKYLAQLAGWQGPASKEARSLAKAMEVTLETLCPKLNKDTTNWKWSIPVKTLEDGAGRTSHPVDLEMRYKNGQWKARVDELDSVISLWLCSIDTEREESSAATGSKLMDDDDGWLRNKVSRAGGGLVLLGGHCDQLTQAFQWWMPVDAPKPSTIEKRKIEERFKEWRVIGSMNSYAREDTFHAGEGSCAEEETDDSDDDFYTEAINEVEEDHAEDVEDEVDQDAVAEGNDALEEDHVTEADSRVQQNFTSELNDEVEESAATARPCLTQFFYTESNDGLEQLYARHIFHAFVSAAAEEMEDAIDDHSEMENPNTFVPGEWDNLRLRGSNLNKLAGAIRDSGLMDLNQAYLALIPPLHAGARLGELNCVIEATFAQAKLYQKNLDWVAAGRSYRGLLKLVNISRQESYTFIRAVALAGDYIRTIEGLPKDPERPGRDLFPEARHAKKTLLCVLDSDLYTVIRESLDTLHGCKLWFTCHMNVDELVGIPGFNFTELHAYAARHDVDSSYYVSGDEESDLSSVPEDLWVHSTSQDILGCTPLHYVAAWRDRKVGDWIDSLVRKGADINATDIRGRTPLDYAIMNQHVSATKDLVQRGANIKVAGVDGMTSLHHAALTNFGYLVSALLSSRRQIADQFARDNYGRAPIHLAASNGCEDVIEHLRGSVEAKDAQGKTPMQLAAYGNHSETIIALSQQGANVDGRTEGSHDTALLWAVSVGNVELIKTLLEAGADANKRTDDRGTPFHRACFWGDVEIVNVLLAHGADINCQERDGQTPLILAARWGRAEMVRSLVGVNNIDLNFKDEDGKSAARWAVESGHHEIAEILQASGAIIDPQTEALMNNGGRSGNEEREG